MPAWASTSEVSMHPYVLVMMPYLWWRFIYG